MAELPQTKTKPVVAIVGCGAAGLGAATTLNQHCNLIILEARNRIGGRTYTVECGDNRVPVDLGASWVEGVGRNKHGETNPMTLQAQKLWKSSETSPNNGLGSNSAIQRYTFYEEEKDGRGKTYEERIKKRNKVIEHEMNKIIEKAEEDMSLEDARILAMKKIGYSVNDEEERSGAMQCQLSAVEQYYGGNRSDMSAMWFDAAEENCYQGRELWVQNGYGTLVSSFATEDIMSKVRLNHVVTKIRYVDRGNVVVSTRDTANGNQEIDITCDAVVVALPIGVLQSKSVEFDPPLPKAKEDAIHGLGSALMNKIVMVFEKQFWGDDDLGGWTFASKTRGKFRMWIAPEKEEPVLMCLLPPDYAKVSEDLSDEELKREALSVLVSCFPDAGSDIRVTHFYRSRWGNDPLSRGTWTYIPVGSHPDIINTLAEPIDDCLFFAGECTNRTDFSTVHGAFDSGKRAGEEILARY